MTGSCVLLLQQVAGSAMVTARLNLSCDCGEVNEPDKQRLAREAQNLCAQVVVVCGVSLPSPQPLAEATGTVGIIPCTTAIGSCIQTYRQLAGRRHELPSHRCGDSQGFHCPDAQRHRPEAARGMVRHPQGLHALTKGGAPAGALYTAASVWRTK